MVHLKKIHEGNLWRGYRAVIYFTLTKQIFLHFYQHRDQFCNRYVNTIGRENYLDDDGTRVKPNKILQRRNKYTSSCYPLQEMWDIYKKITRDNFGRKIKSTVFIYLPGSKFRQAEGLLMLIFC